MKMKTRRRISAISILLALGLLLSSCSPKATYPKRDFSFVSEYEKVDVIFSQNADTPWGFSVGTVGYEGKNCLLMLPQTQVSVDLNGTVESIAYTWRIHPWVVNNSDGMAVNISVIDIESGKVVYSEDVDLPQSTENVSGELKLSLKSESKYKVAVSAKAGKSGVEDCDWVLIECLKVTGFFEVLSTAKKPAAQVPDHEYLISANYFCGGWPKNLWDCEPKNIDGDFTKLRQDGFNSIILLIPWRQFQPTVDPITYNPVALERLENVMNAADRNGLKVVLRIAYFHDYYQNGDASELDERFRNAIQPGAYREALLQYADTVYRATSVHQSYAGSFICWEDFWGVVNMLKSSDSLAFHLECAGILGYQDFLQKNYTVDQFNQIYGTQYTSFEEIPVPFVHEPAFKTFYDAYDQALNNLLYDMQNAVPNLSMEVRLDADLITLADGSQAYYPHAATFQCLGSDFVSTVYGIPMGCANQGEQLTAGEALEKTSYMLGDLRNQINGKKLYVDQFLFYDDTVEFSYNARLRLEEIGPYLRQVGGVLRQNTCGIGIWTYQNYLFNAVYNWQFADGLTGWETTGDVELLTEGSMRVKMLADASVSQRIPLNRSGFANGNTVTVRFTVCNDTGGTVTVVLGSQSKTININGAGDYSLTFPYMAGNDALLLGFSANCSVELDNINLYNYVQNGLLYDEYGNELANIADMRVLIQNILNYDDE